MKKIALIFISILIFMTIFPFFFRHTDKIYSNATNITTYSTVCLLGAKVYANSSLSPVVQQRCDTVVKLQEIHRNRKFHIIISGSGNYEVNNITNYLVSKGIKVQHITKDINGINTGRTIAYLKENNFNNILFISQSFHLHRTIEMASDNGIVCHGLAAERIAPLTENISIVKKYIIRLTRFYKSSFLLALHKLNIYNMLSSFKE